MATSSEHRNGGAGQKRQGLRLFAARSAAALTRAVFGLFGLFPQRQKVVLMSRQGARPLDFCLLEPELRAAFPECEVVWACVAKGGELSLAVFAKQLWHAATARLCVVDGYVPAVSLCAGLHRAACVQLWHALGAVKKFGCQSLDTPAGHASSIAGALRIHEGYDCLVAGLGGAAEAFSQAFGCEGEKILPLGLLRIDYVLERRGLEEQNRLGELALDAELEKLRGLRAEGRLVVLYAPTFRKGAGFSEGWLAESVCALNAALSDAVPDAVLAVAKHPLRTVSLEGSQVAREDSLVCLSRSSAVDALCCVDAVVSDYSAVVFEAWLAGKGIFFYAPDADAYRASPGLNVDPLREFPDVAFERATDLASALCDFAGCASGGGLCPGGAPLETRRRSSFDAFMKGYAAGVELGSARRIAACARNLVLAKDLAGAPPSELGEAPFGIEEGEGYVVGRA